MKQKLIFFLSYSVIILLFSFCKKTFDNPPYKTLNEGAQISISQLKQKIAASTFAYKFGLGDTNLYCTVTGDESSGNLYKQVYVRDEAGAALQINLLNPGGLFVGDKIRINLNGIYLISANSMVYLDSVDLEKSMVKLSSGNAVTPKVTTISDILKYANNPLDPSSLQSQLVELNNVEFDSVSRGKSFADAIGKAAINRTLTTCSYQKITVRTSGRSNFSAKVCPNGNGKVIALVSQYANDMQLTIRNYNELQMDGKLCTGPTPTVVVTNTFVLASAVNSLSESFDAVTSSSDFTPIAWINFNEIGSVKWKGHLVSSTYKALKASAYNSGNSNNSMWLISPPINYKNSLTLSFKSGFAFWDAGHPNALMAYVSTNFNGSNFSSANWTPITSANYADGNGSQYTGPFGLKASGTITLNSMALFNNYSGTFFIAFKHMGSTAFNSDIYLDDIVVQ